MTPDALNVLKALKKQNHKMTPSDMALYLHIDDCYDIIPAFQYLEKHKMVSRVDHKNDPAGVAPDYAYRITTEGVNTIFEEEKLQKQEHRNQIRDWVTLVLAFISALTGIIGLFVK